VLLTQLKAPYTIEEEDITLVDANNRELDMGTPFDFFGKRPAMVMLNYQMKQTTGSIKV
jgi:D-alanyl-D-alanine dipeptidase